MMVSDTVFKVNIKKLALLALPTWLRKPLVSALIYAGVSPLAKIIQNLRAYRAKTFYRLNHNGQVCKLRGVLNDEFDPELRRISIEDQDSSSRAEFSTIYQRELEQWKRIPCRCSGSAIINTRGFGGTSGVDFWINVPSDLKSEQTEIRMKALVNSYKLASKRFTIIYT